MSSTSLLSELAVSNKIERIQAAGWLKSDRLAIVAVTAIMLAASMTAHSTANVPLIDDWTYAWSVEHLLKTGELRVLDWSAHYPLAQIIWAALFAKLFGFSFFILRLSTVVLALLGMLAFYLTLRLLDVNRLFSALGTLFVFFNPVWFVLSHSFMTDVPFLSVMNLTLLYYVLWAQRRRPAYLLLGSAFAVVAFLIRQTGALLPLVPFAYLLLWRRFGGERRSVSSFEWLLLLLPFAGVGLTLWWVQNVHGATSVYLDKANALNYALSASWWFSTGAWASYFQGMVLALMHLGFVLSPLALATLWGRSRLVLGISAALMLVMLGLYIWAFAEIPNPIASGQTLSLEELGGSRALVNGDVDARQLPDWMGWALLALSLSSSAVIVAVMLEGFRKQSRWIAQPGVILLIGGVLQFLAIEGLWLYYDRYYITLLPGFAALLIGTMQRTRIVTTTIALGVLIFGSISVTGTIDNFQYNRAVLEAREWVLSQGAAPSQVDAGYALNGWWLYAHPENLLPGAHRETDVPFVTSKDALLYVIANSPMPSYEVIRIYRWQSFWAVSDAIYALRQLAATAQ